MNIASRGNIKIAASFPGLVAISKRLMSFRRSEATEESKFWAHKTF